MKLHLCWFRSDLRVRDNSALISALEQGPTIAIYIATPQQWQEHDDAPVKIDFWRRNLLELENSLQTLNIPLLYFQVPRYRDITALFQKLLSSWDVSGIHFNKEYPLNERLRDQALEKLADRYGVRVVACDDQVLIPPASLLNKAGQPFKVFTPYARAARDLLGSSRLGKSTRLRKQENIEHLPVLAEQKQVHEIEWPDLADKWSVLWPAGEKTAGSRLADFSETAVRDYKKQRDFPAINGTSILSPYLASGVISIRECWDLAQYVPGNDSVLAWQNELLWRDFYKSIMYHYPHVCKGLPWDLKYKDFPWSCDTEKFQRWCAGETGFPLVDAAMRQLQQSGWMHNRLRMVVAMFLSKNLLLDWRLGEKWFMQHLIDGDFSANNGGWQWSASTGTDAVPYFRIFNPVTQSQRFDPEGKFIRRYIPELSAKNANNIHDPDKFTVGDYYPPLIDLKLSRQLALAAFKRAV